MQTVTRKDCVEAATPSIARKTRFRLLAQRGMSRKYGFTVDSLCGSPLCIREEHVIYRPWKALTKPTKWGEYAKKLAALRVGKSFEIADYPHSNVNLRATLVAAPQIPQAQLANAVTTVPSGRAESPATYQQSVTPQAANAGMLSTEGSAHPAERAPTSSQEALNVKSSGAATPILEEKDTSSWVIREVESAGTGTPIIMITSTPAGADIFIDSAGLGRTPRSIEISPGKHSVQLVLNGYKDQLGDISPRVGYKLAVEVSMEK